MYWTTIIGFLFTYQLGSVLSQKGEFYEPLEGKHSKVLMNDSSKVRSKVVNLTSDINFFGETVKSLKVSTILLILHSNFAKV